MKKTFTVILCCLLAGLSSLNARAQGFDCITLDSSQKKLYLNGDNFTLVDNALRCFKLNSIAKERDSLVRIWILEDDFPDTPTTWRVKMFEFGKRGDVPTATLHLLEWGYVENDSSLHVKCIKQIRMTPNKGWVAFEKKVRSLNLPTLYKKPFVNNGIVIVDYGMFVVQFLFGHTTHTVDFSGLLEYPTSINALHFDHSKRLAYLVWYLEKHFSIKLSVDQKGRDFLKNAMRHLNLRKE